MYSLSEKAPMEYQGPNQRPTGNFEGLNKSHITFNWPQEPPAPPHEVNEAMLKMSIQPSDSYNGLESLSGPYPERPGVADCAFFIRTGSCKFGQNCRFNHPPDREQVSQTGDLPDKAGQIECQFFLKGTCKYGAICKYSHSNHQDGSEGKTQCNFLGLPIRQGERECLFYMRTGSCKYGVTCRYHHPEPASEAIAASVSNSPVQVATRDPLSETSHFPVSPSWPITRASDAANIRSQEHAPYMHAMYPFPQDMSPTPAWSNNYQAPIDLLSSWEGKQLPIGIGLMNMQTNRPFLGGSQAPTGRPLLSSAVGPFGLQSTVTVTQRETFPERPGQPECQHYLKTGNCKFGAACKFHHPKRTELSGPRNSLPPSEKTQLSVGIDFENNIKQLNDLGTSSQGSVYSTSRPVSSTTTEFPAGQSQTTFIQKRTFPERPGHPECQHYLKTGDCKFGDDCRYHHPKERFEQSSEFTCSQTSLPVHYVHVSPFAFSEEKQHYNGKSTVNPIKQPNDLASTGVHSVRTSTEPLYSATSRVPTVHSQDLATQRGTFPERPGQPECSYYMKTGDCKFGAACKNHHPREHSEKQSASKLTEMGLPLHPDKPACTFYSQFGICKFGPTCKYDHPLRVPSYNPSVRLNSELPWDHFSKGVSSTNT